MSLRARLIRNGLAAGLQKSVRILDQLLLVPFFLSAWGAAYYGEWLTLMVIPTVIGFSDMGFGTSAANAFILRYAANDKQGAANIAASGFFAIHVTVAIGLSATCGFTLFAGQTNLLTKSLIPQNEAIQAVAYMVAGRILCFYHQLSDAHFSALRRAHTSMNYQTIYGIISLALSIAVLTQNGDIVKFTQVNFAWTLIYTFIYALVARNTLQLHNTIHGYINRRDLQFVFMNGFGYLLSPIWQAIFFQGTTLAVRATLGPVAVTIFNTVRTVARTTNQIYTMVISATLSELQYEIGAGDFDRARQIFRIGLAIILAVALTGMATLLLGGNWLYEAWTNKILSPPQAMWYIFIAGIIFNAIWWPASFIFQAMNRPYEFATAGVVCATISTLMSYVLARNYGLTGAALGTVLLDVLLFIYVLPRACTLIGMSIFELPKTTWSDCKALWQRQIKFKLRKQ